MRFGAHQFIFVERWSDAALPVLDRARALGLEAFELAAGDDVAFDPRATRRRADALGLALVLGPGGAWPMECDVSADDPEHRRRGEAWHERMIDLAAALGAVAYTGALYGHPGRVLRRAPPPDETARAAEALHRLAERAARRGVALAIEPMSRFRTHLVNTPGQAMRLVALADHPNLAVVLDTWHLVTEVRDYAAAVRATRGRLWGVHACENDRGRPGGGIVPWRPFLAALAEEAGDAWVLLESYNTAIPGFARSRGVFQDLCPDAEAFVRDGIGFLRGELAAVAGAGGQPP